VFVSRGDDAVQRITPVLRGDIRIALRGTHPDGEAPFRATAAQRALSERAGLPARLWSERRLTAELKIFTRDVEQWPLFDDFHAAGRSDLHAQAARRGGSAIWAPRLGFDIRQDFYDHVAWDEQAVRNTLELIVRDREEMPSYRELRDKGLDGLVKGIVRSGGITRWAVALDKRPKRLRPKKWTDAEVEAELRGLVATLGHYPSQREFCDAGLGGLDGSIRRRSTHQEWATRIGAPRRKDSAPKIHWTDDLIERQLRSYVAGANAYPSDQKFDRDSQSRLADAAARHHGHDYWAHRLGLRRPYSSRRRLVAPHHGGA